MSNIYSRLFWKSEKHCEYLPEIFLNSFWNCSKLFPYHDKIFFKNSSKLSNIYRRIFRKSENLCEYLSKIFFNSLKLQQIFLIFQQNFLQKFFKIVEYLSKNFPKIWESLRILSFQNFLKLFLKMHEIFLIFQ